ncbi:MAG: hypothetical protein LBJ16_03780 [Holosporaceae bacterium]|jgi:hypothetical protein|nr:hypothetical protein [Holosporaceae bacterium]
MIIGKKRFAIAMMMGLFAIGLGDQAEGYVKDTNGVLRCENKEKNRVVKEAYFDFLKKKNQSIEKESRGEGKSLEDYINRDEFKPEEERSVQGFLVHLATPEAPDKESSPFGRLGKEKSKMTLLRDILMEGALFGIKMVDTCDKAWSAITLSVVNEWALKESTLNPDLILGYFLNPPKDKKEKEVWKYITNIMRNHWKIGGVEKLGGKTLSLSGVFECNDEQKERKLRRHLGLGKEKETLVSLFESENLKTIIGQKDDGNKHMQLRYGDRNEGMKLSDADKRVLWLIELGERACGSKAERDELCKEKEEGGNRGLYVRMSEDVLKVLEAYAKHIKLETIRGFAKELCGLGLAYIITRTDEATGHTSGRYVTVNRAALDKAVREDEENMKLTMLMSYLEKMGDRNQGLGLKVAAQELLERKDDGELTKAGKRTVNRWNAVYGVGRY